MSLLRPITLSLIGISTGLAQPQVPPAPDAPLIQPTAPGGNNNAPAPGQPAPPPQPPQQNVPLGETKIVQSIIEPKLSGGQLAALYRTYTGRRVIVSAQAALAEFSFVQDASPQDPLTYSQAAELLRKAATIENFIFVPDATDPNLDFLTYAAGGTAGASPKQRGIEIYTENDTLPEGDAVISYVMNLQYLKPDAVVATFQQVIGQFGVYGSIAPVANASAVIITENTSLIRRLIDLKKEIDKPSSQVATRFIKVEYADVTELANTLNDLLTAQQTAQRTAGVQRTGAAPAPQPAAQGGAPDGAPGGGGGTSPEENPPQIVAEPRTNRIFAMGRPVDLIFIEGLVREFDVETDQRNFLRRRLHFLAATDFLPIASDALTRAFSAGDATGGGGAGVAPGAQGGTRSSAAGARGGSTANRSGASTANTGGSFGGAATGGGLGGGAGGGVGSSGGLGNANSVPASSSVLVGRTLLVADTITNSVVVQGPPSGVEIINKLLDEIDVKADQVMLSCVFGQLDVTDGFSFGVDYVSTLRGRFAGRGGSGTGRDSGIDLLPGTDFDPGLLARGAGLSLYGQIGNNLNIYLDAKQSDSNFKVLSRPTIFTSNNQKGSIVSGTQIAVPTSSFSSGVSTTASTNYEYKDVAIKLEVIPLINSENEVTLDVFLTSDDVGADRSVGTGDNTYVIPDILKRELVTRVTVPNGETIVLGGLITESTRTADSGIPVLSRIPVVGPLFGSKTKDDNRSELLIFIQPSIVHGQSTLDAAQVDMDSRYKTAPDTRRFADGPGVLPPPDSIPISDKTSSPGRSPAAEPAPKPTTANPYPHGTRFPSIRR